MCYLCADCVLLFFLLLHAATIAKIINMKTLVNTTLCYIEKDGCYLMLHRTKKENDYNKDKWIGIGGKFENGESPEDCVRREIHEETGLIVQSEDLEYCGIVTFVDKSEEDTVGEDSPSLQPAQQSSATPSPKGQSPLKTPENSEKEDASCDGVLFSVRASDLPELPSLAKKYYDLGFKLYATTGNAATIERSGMNNITYVAKVHENYSDNVMTLLESGKIRYVVSTSAKGRYPDAESVRLRRLAVERDIDCLTSMDTANALADCLASPYTIENTSLVDMNSL